jgi:dolichol-phosphate mannosyltransferase
MKTIIVIPTYNERENIEQLAKLIIELGEDFHILIVDDNSPDGTGEIADKLARELEQVKVIHRARKLGLGTAYVEGFKCALKDSADYIFEMDADFSHDSKYLSNFMEAIKDNDLILGSRYVRGGGVVNWPFRRLLLSKMASFYVRAITGLPVADPTGGFKCFRRNVLESIGLDDVRSNGYAFQIEMTYKAWKKGFRIKEIPIIFVERGQGKSKMGLRIILEAIWIVWRLKLSGYLR